MALLQKLRNANFTYKSIGEFETGHEYLIEDMTKGNGQYGPTVLVNLISQRGDLIRAYLPKRFSDAISEKEALEYEKGSMALIFEGKIKNSFKITFKEINDFRRRAYFLVNKKLIQA